MLKNMKVKKSLILGYGITIVISVALIIASLMMMNNQRGQYEMLMNEDVETNMAILNARVNAITAGRNYRDALLVPESSANESLIAQAEAALEAGFSDQSHFTNCFTAITGLTPGAYRALFREKWERG